MIEPIPYTTQRVRRFLERAWTKLEAAIDRMAAQAFNPLYHLGTLQITLLVIITVTGIYLTIFYRPGAERAFESVAGISATWLGSLMRTVHRYASAALIVVALLHALKSFLRDQARGPRWLPWVTGWLLFVLFWVIGVLGYWLPWDGTAQWVSEWAMEFGSGASVITFIEPSFAPRTFMFFVIVLFLHIFLSVLILFWILIHVFRISNVTIWAPRWVLISGSALLAMLAVARPATIGHRADLSQFVGTVELDHWYLGYLPLIGNIGNALLWGGSLVMLLLMLAVPWIVPGRRDRKATVDPGLCNGNARCADVCPYGAIEMIARDDDSGHDRLAVVDPNLCTACGLCVGVCPTEAIEIPDIPTRVVRDEFTEVVRAEAANSEPVVAVFACARHAAMGGLPAEVENPIEVVGGAEATRLAVATVACSGMVNSRWMKDVKTAGAGGVVCVSCSRDDCRFEQGPTQLAIRMDRGWIKRDPDVHRLEVAPTDVKALKELLHAIQASNGSHGERKSRKPLWLKWALGAVVLASMLLLPSIGIRSTEKAYPADAGLRIAFVHGGEFLPIDLEEIGGEFNPDVSPEQLAGSARHPVVLSVTVDGEQALDETYPPAGLRNEGKSSTVDTLWLGVGEYQVVVEMMDDGENFRVVFDDLVVLEEERILTLLWDEHRELFEEVSR